jgi:hypothetical protein
MPHSISLKEDCLSNASYDIIILLRGVIIIIDLVFISALLFDKLVHLSIRQMDILMLFYLGS